MNKINFGTDGWRAVIAEDFTFENVEIASKAIGLYIKEAYGTEKTILVGYDTRFLADKFALRANQVLAEMGFKVKLTKGDLPTPVLAYAAKNLETAGALMFTASHNPAEYCGIKYIPDYAGPATKEITDIIIKNVEKIQKEGIEIHYNPDLEPEYIDLKQDYFNHLKTLIDFEKIAEANINIIFDPLYATGRGYFDEFLKSYGCKVKSINDWRDPLYGGQMPDPKPKYLSDLINLVKENNNAVGFSNDGDADRFGVIDENGNFITPNEIIAILFKHLRKYKNLKGSLIKTVAGSFMLDKLAELYDTPVIETPVGFKWVGEQMRTNEFVIGGEESGGLSISGHIPEKDGILANLCVLEAMAYEKKPLYELVADLKKEIGIEYLNKRIDLKLLPEQKDQLMKMFFDDSFREFAKMSVKKVSKKDGIKFYFDDNNSWMLVRPSGTEPLLRIYFETDSEEKLNNFITQINKLV